MLSLATPAYSQGFERTYTLLFKECTQKRLLDYTGETARFSGYLSQRPDNCSATDCRYQYNSTISPNDLLVSLQRMAGRLGYVGDRIGVDGSTYRVDCIGGDRAGTIPTGDPDCLATISKNACGYFVSVCGSVLFDFDKSFLRPAGKTFISEVKRFAEQKNAQAVYVLGHTDSKGDIEYNYGLSDRRACTAHSYLGKTLGFPMHRLFAFGFSELVPVADNEFPDLRDNPHGRQLNRRVEFHIRTEPVACPIKRMDYAALGTCSTGIDPPLATGQAGTSPAAPLPPKPRLDPAEW